MDGRAVRCRGLRKWCNRRCEVTQAMVPAGYPTIGFYCPLHKYQEPRYTADGGARFDNPVIEDHVRKRTSFVAPESTIAADMLKAVGLARDGLAQGNKVVTWLRERRSLDEEAAVAFAQRMVDLGMLVPETPAHRAFRGEKGAAYRIIVPVAGGGGAGGGAAGAGRY
jgi:hypothetical protein